MDEQKSDISPEAEHRFRQLRPLRGLVSLAAYLPVPLMRVMSDGMAAMTAEPGGVEENTAADLAPGLRATWFRPVACKTRTAILYLHGGGYVAGSLKSHRKLVGHIAKAANASVLLLEYRLVPEHPFPSCLEDAVSAYKALLAQRPSTQVIFLGDSAGGGMALSLLIEVKRLGLPQPAAAIALSPMTDFTFSGDSWRTKAQVDLMMTRSAAEASARRVTAGGISRSDPRLSPLFGDLAKLAPVLIQVGGDEVLLSDSLQMADQIFSAGGQVDLEIAPRMQHVFQIMAGNAPEADEAVARIGSFIKQKIS